MKRKPSINYVNNEEFYKMIVEWKKSGDEKIPDKIALTLLKICERLATSGKFSGYTWKDEMIEDALMSCIKFCGNFNPEKSKNPFAFYTQIAYNSFLKRINIENQKLQTLSEYKEQLENLYDISFDEDTDKYSNIDNTAKRINRTFMKKKSPKKNNKRTIDEYISDGETE